MIWNRIQANWPRLCGLAERKWSRITDEELDMIDGNRDRLLATLQARYGISKAEAELEVQEWEAMVRGWEQRQRG
jgi:uncharacterized protein YjbJ (UPF0337 family)